MKAILTKYHSPGNVRGSRISATDGEGQHRIYIGYPYELSGEAVYRKAAEALREKMSWPPLYKNGGGTSDGFVFVFK